LKKREYVVWYIDVSELESWVVAAKIKQLSDWLEHERPFGSRFDVVIIPSKENKVSILKSEEDFREDFQGDLDNWLHKVRDQLEDCLTIHLSLQSNDGGPSDV